MRIAVALLVLGFTVPVCPAQAEKPEPNSIDDFLKRPLEDSLAALKDKDGEIRFSARIALTMRESLPDSAIPKLIEALANNKDEEVRGDVASILGRLGEHARRAVPALRTALKDRSLSVRVEAAIALRSLMPREKVLSILLEGLEAEEKSVRRNAASALADMPWKAEAAVEPLRKHLHDKEDNVRLQAARALWLINRAPAAAAVLLEIAKSPQDQDVRQDAIPFLALPGLDVAAVMPILRAALKDKDERVRLAVIIALIRVDAPVNERRSLLRMAMKDSRQEVRQIVKDTLLLLGPVTAPAVSDLIASLKSNNKKLRGDALNTLSGIGPAAAPAVPALVELLRGSEDDEREQVLATLLAIGPAAHQALPAVRAKLTDVDAQIRLSAATVVWRIDNDAKARRCLLEAMKDKNANIRVKVADLLCQVGPAAKEMLPHLRPLLRDADSEVRLNAALALWTIDKDKSAIAVLIALLRDKNRDVREQTAKKLGNIGADAKKAVPALQRALDDEDGEVQRTAYEALQKITPPKTKP